MNDPYYNPEAFGLESFGEVELEEPCWSFDIFMVWRVKDTGEFAWATDSGCSCPSPFENFDREDLEYGSNIAAMLALDKAVEGNEEARNRSLDLVTKLVFAQ